MSQTNFAKAINNIGTTVAIAYTAGAGKLYVTSAAGINLAGGQWIRITLIRTGQILTILRANSVLTDGNGTYLTIAGPIDGYSDVALNVTDIVEMRITAGAFTDIHTAINNLESTAAVDTLVVHLAGTETVTGSKTFSQPVVANITGTAATITGNVPESQVTNLTTDLAAKANDNAVVHITGSETITGIKGFSQTILGNISGSAGTITGSIPESQVTNLLNDLAAKNDSNIAARTYHGGRLTLSSGDPTADNVTNTTVYYTPYTHDLIGLYNQSTTTWYTMGFGELSFVVPNFAFPVDVFAFNNSGVVALELAGWTNAVTRAISLAYIDHVLVKGTDASRLYLGTYMVGSGTTVYDNPASRLVWNNYNRIQKKVLIVDPTISWAASSGVWRVANGNVNNNISVVVGVKEHFIQLSALVSGANAIQATTALSTGIGYDSSTVNTPDLSFTGALFTTGINAVAQCNLNHKTDVGSHHYYWLEFASEVSANITIYGLNAIAGYSSGLGGLFWC